jgi:diacylglycerol kinase (ATP)
MPYPANEPHLTPKQPVADADHDGDAGPRIIAASADGGEARVVRRRFLIIHNPVAGRNRVGLVHDVVRRLGQAGAIADVMSLSEMEADNNFAARIGTYDAIVASGGDGTARSIASRLEGQETPFALIPAGTGNVLAAELDLPRDALAIAQMLRHGPLVRLSIGAVNGSPFLLMFGAGFDGQVIARLPLALKRRVGRLAFGWPVIAALAQKPRMFQATIDGQTYEASWVVVANASRYGSRFVLSPRTNILSPGFNAVISRATSRRQRLWELLHIMVGRLERAGSIVMRPARGIEIGDAEGLPVQVDGERLASSSYRIEAEVSGASMIVPATRRGRARD